MPTVCGRAHGLSKHRRRGAVVEHGSCCFASAYVGRRGLQGLGPATHARACNVLFLTSSPVSLNCSCIAEFEARGFLATSRQSEKHQQPWSALLAWRAEAAGALACGRVHSGTRGVGRCDLAHGRDSGAPLHAPHSVGQQCQVRAAWRGVGPAYAVHAESLQRLSAGVSRTAATLHGPDGPQRAADGHKCSRRSF